MSGIFDEKSMVYVLEKNIPGGEKLRAGIHACAYELQVNRIFSGGVLVDNLLVDIGNCYPLEEIRYCEMKKGWMGSVKCNITMKNGDYFKLMLPKRGGLGGDMPHHAQYREDIIACLRAHGNEI